MANDRIEYKVTGDPSDFLSAMGRIQQAGKEAFDRVSERAEVMKGAMEGVEKVFTTIATVLAGGVIFKESIDKTVELAQNSQHLAQSFHLTTQEASVLVEALSDLHIDADTFVAAGQKLTNQLRAHEDGLNKLGLRTRDASGHLRDMEALMLDSIHVVNSYKEGTDRNAAAQEFFGRNADDLRLVLQLNNNVLDEARKKAEALGLVQGPEQIAAVKEYRAAMNDFGTAVESLKVSVGQAALPTLTRLAEWFATTIPKAVEATRVSFAFFTGSFASWFTQIKGEITELKEYFTLLGRVAADALTLNWGKIASDWEAGAARIKQVQFDWHARQQQLDQDTLNRLRSIVSGADRPKVGGNTSAPPAGGRDFVNPNPPGGKNARIQQWDEELEAQKTAFALEQQQQGTFLEFSKATEAAYWQDKLKTAGLSTQEKLAIERKFLAASDALRRESVAQEFADFKAQEERYRTNMDARLAIAQKAMERAKQLYGVDSKEYRQAAQEIVQIERQKQEQLKQIRELGIAASEKAALDQVTYEERLAQLNVAAGFSTDASLLQQSVTFEQRRYEIALEALQQRLELAQKDPDKNPVLLAQLYQQVEDLERQHQLRLGEIRKQQQVESRSEWNQTIQNWRSTWTQGLSALLQGQLKFRNAWRGLLASLWQGFADLTARLIARWFFTEAAKTQATTAGVAARAAAERLGSIQSLLISAFTAVKTIIHRAYEAIAGAYAAISAIPFVGPFIAPAVAAGVGVAVFSLAGNVASAAGGYDIPGSINPLIQAHAKEMVLPAKHADVIRDLADKGGARGGGDTFIIQATDAKSFQKMLLDNAPAVGMAVRKHARNGGFNDT